MGASELRVAAEVDHPLIGEQRRRVQAPGHGRVIVAWKSLNTGAGAGLLRWTGGAFMAYASGLAAADEMTDVVGDHDGQGAEGELAQTRAQHGAAGQPAD